MKGNSDRNSAKKQKASPRRIDGSKKHRNGRRPARNDSPDTRGTNGKSGISKTRSRRRKPGRGSASEENRSANTCPAELTEGLPQWTCRECTPSETLSAPLTTLSTGAVTGRVTGRKQKARDGSVENQGGGEGVAGGSLFGEGVSLLPVEKIDNCKTARRMSSQRTRCNGRTWSDGYRIDNIATRWRGEKEEVEEPRGNNFFKRASMAISTAFSLQYWVSPSEQKGFQ